jgi:ATP-binding cassette, subfamily F, member 3
MPLISLSNISFDYGRVPILKKASLSLEPGERAAIVGRNGVGKSTLFSIIMRELRPDEGSVDLSRRLRIAYLRQDHALAGGRDLFDAVRNECSELIDLESRMETALTQMESLPPEGEQHDRAAARYGEIHHQYESLGGYDLDQRVAATLTGLGFPLSDFKRRVELLSGGEQRVAALAAVLLQNADLLLLDEPTNHLDLRAIEWLENHLMDSKSALLMVSHDRSFLNRLGGVTFHLRDARLTRYSGNYSFFEKARTERDRQDMLAWNRQQEEIARKEEYIRRNIVGQKTKQAQSRRKQLAKLERLDKPTSERTMRVHLTPARRGGNTVLVAEKLAKAFDEKKLFKGVDLHISRGERIGLVGANGAGKTTLVRILMGRLPADTGSVVPGKDVDLGFFDQHLDLVSDTHTVTDEFLTVNPMMGEGELRGELARFGFFTDDLDKKVGQLSGGERNRLSLLKLVYGNHNFLVLDEPTNHLDIAATESLEEALEAYEGTLLVISHDRSFLERLADRVIEVEGGQVTDYPGTWREFSAWKRAQALGNRSGGDPRKGGGGLGGGDRNGGRARSGDPGEQVSNGNTSGGHAGGDGATAAGGARSTSTGGWSKNKLSRKQRSLQDLEGQIAAATVEKEELEAKLAAGSELGRDEILRFTCRHQELVETLTRREARWESLAEEIEEQG